jgi:hypothetical protein
MAEMRISLVRAAYGEIPYSRVRNSVSAGIMEELAIGLGRDAGRGCELTWA